MRVFYAIYAIAVIGLLCIQRAESLPWRLALWLISLFRLPG